MRDSGNIYTHNERKKEKNVPSLILEASWKICDASDSVLAGSAQHQAPQLLHYFCFPVPSSNRKILVNEGIKEIS